MDDRTINGEGNPILMSFVGCATHHPSNLSRAGDASSRQSLEFPEESRPFIGNKVVRMLMGQLCRIEMHFRRRRGLEHCLCEADLEF